MDAAGEDLGVDDDEPNGGDLKPIVLRLIDHVGSVRRDKCNRFAKPMCKFGAGKSGNDENTDSVNIGRLIAETQMNKSDEHFRRRGVDGKIMPQGPDENFRRRGVDQKAMPQGPDGSYSGSGGPKQLGGGSIPNSPPEPDQAGHTLGDKVETTAEKDTRLIRGQRGASARQQGSRESRYLWVFAKNCRSLKADDDVRELLEEMKHVQWDIILLNETWRGEPEEVWDTEEGHRFLATGCAQGRKELQFLSTRGGSKESPTSITLMRE